MDIRKVKKLIELLEESGVSEIEIREGEESVRITRGAQPAPPAAARVNAPPPATAPPVNEPAASRRSAERPGLGRQGPDRAARRRGLHH